MLETTLGEHISKCRYVHKNTVGENVAIMYKDDLISSGYKKEEVIQLKEVVFTLHK